MIQWHQQRQGRVRGKMLMRKIKLKMFICVSVATVQISEKKSFQGAASECQRLRITALS
jgi:hypothetical protein